MNAARDTGDGMSGVVKLRQELFYLVSGTLMGAETSHQAVSPVLGSCKLAGTVGTSSPQAPVGCACVRDERSTTLLTSSGTQTPLHLVWVIIHWVILDLVGAMDLLNHS